MHFDNFAEKYHALRVDQKRRGIGCFIECIPSEPVQIGELVAGVQQQVEVVRKFLTGQKLACLNREILRRTGVRHDQAYSGFGEALGVLNKILNLPVTVWALIATISPKHDQDDRTLWYHFGKPDGRAAHGRQREIRGSLANARRCGSRLRKHGGQRKRKDQKTFHELYLSFDIEFTYSIGRSSALNLPIDNVKLRNRTLRRGRPPSAPPSFLCGQLYVAARMPDAYQPIPLCPKSRIKTFFDFHLHLAFEYARRTGAALPDTATGRNPDAKSLCHHE